MIFHPRIRHVAAKGPVFIGQGPILSTFLSLSRNLEGFQFPATASANILESVAELSLAAMHHEDVHGLLPSMFQIKHELLTTSDRELLVERDSSLVLFYHPEAMKCALRDPANRAILARCGYPADADARALLNELQRRFRLASGLPHEVGVFLGYPAKDVAGFMANLPRTPVEHGRWAVYGDATESVARMTLYRRIEAAAERVLNVCGDTRTFLEHISTLNTTIGVM